MSRILTRRNLLTTGAALLGSAAVTAFTPNGRLPEVVTGRAPAVHPQGVAWDPTRNAFVVGSIRHGTVSVVRLDGSVRTLASHPELISTSGVHVDERRGRLLAGYVDVGLGEATTPETQFRSSGLAIFDLSSGRPRRLIGLDDEPGPHIVTDFALADDGVVYATDLASDVVHRIDRRGHATLLVRDPRFNSDGFGLAGVAWHPREFLLAVSTGSGSLFRISLCPPYEVDVVALDQPLVGADGIALRPDGALLVVQNPLAVPTAANAVAVLRSRDRWRTARTVARHAWPEPDPTTVTVTPAGSYAVSGRLRQLAAGQFVDDFVIRRVAGRA